MRLAAIDLGTVTCRLLVADVRDGRIFPIAKEYAIVNLGEGVDVAHRLKAEALQRAESTLADFLRIRDRLDTPQDPIVSTVCVATSASRDAENSSELEAIFAKLGLTVQVISGTREAELTFMGAGYAFAGEDLMVVDVGGGSTEIVFGAAGSLGAAEGEDEHHRVGRQLSAETGSDPLCAHSYDIGSRRITERFLHSDPPAQDELDRARRFIREALEGTAQYQEILAAMEDGNAVHGSISTEGAEAASAPADNVKAGGAPTGNVPKGSDRTTSTGASRENAPRLVAVAGTATSVVSIREEMIEYDSSRVHGSIVSAEELASITQRLASIPLHQRERVVGLDPKRAPVIVAGLVILQEVMRLYRQPSFTVSESDILSGIIISEYEKANRPV